MATSTAAASGSRDSILVPVRWAVVSSRTTLSAQSVSAVTSSGDQLCIIPRGRTL